MALKLLYITNAIDGSGDLEHMLVNKTKIEVEKFRYIELNSIIFKIIYKV